MREGPPLTLYCFPHAGAGVSAFSRWTTTIGAGIEVVPVSLPGRDTRRRESRVTDRESVLAEVLPALGPPPHGRYVLYGHSLGGLIAYTVARAVHDAGLNLPALVVVGAALPPDTPAAELEDPDLPDDELVRLMAGLGSIPSGSEPGDVWQRATLPVLRDDLRLARALRAAADRPLSAPLLVIAGRDDPLAGPRVMAGWRRWTTGRFVERTVPGGHFFSRGPELPRVLRRAVQVVRRIADPAPYAQTPFAQPAGRRTSRSGDGR